MISSGCSDAGDGAGLAVLELTTTLDVPAEAVWEAIHDPRFLVRITAPLLNIHPVEPKAFPDRFVPAHYIVGLKALGVLPLGRQKIHIEYPAPEPDEPLPRYLMCDHGSGDLARSWIHRITIIPVDEDHCTYTDRVELSAGLLTPLVVIFARLYFRHRQGQLRRLAKRGFA